MLQPHETVVWEVIEGVVTVCNLEDGVVHRLNPVGGVVWMAGVAEDRDGVLARVHERYIAVDVDVLRGDVDGFVVDLRDRNLIADQPRWGQAGRS